MAIEFGKNLNTSHYTEEWEKLSEAERLSYIKEHMSDYAPNNAAKDFFDSYAKEHKITRWADVFYLAGVPKSYGYEIIQGGKSSSKKGDFNSNRFNPKRDYILAICIEADMDLIHTNRALKLLNRSELYVKDLRDSVIIMGIQAKKMLAEINETLDDCGFAMLSECPIEHVNADAEESVSEEGLYETIDEETLEDALYTYKEYGYNTPTYIIPTDTEKTFFIFADDETVADEHSNLTLKRKLLEFAGEDGYFYPSDFCSIKPNVNVLIYNVKTKSKEKTR